MNYDQPWLWAVIAGAFLVLVLLERLGPVSLREEITGLVARYRTRHLHHSRERMATCQELGAAPAPPALEPPAVRILPPESRVPDSGGMIMYAVLDRSGSMTRMARADGDTHLDPLPAIPAPRRLSPEDLRYLRVNTVMQAEEEHPIPVPGPDDRLLSAEARTEQLAALRADCEYCGEDHTGDCEKSELARALRRRGVHLGSIAFEKALGRPVSYVVSPISGDTITGMELPEPRRPVRVHPGEQVRIQLPPPPAIPEVNLLEDYDPALAADRIRSAYDRAEAEQQRRIDEAEQLSRQIWAAEHPAAG